MSGSLKKYFGGSKARDGLYRKLEATTFAEFVGKYFNVPIMFPLTRTEFLAHPDRDVIKDVPFVCPCTFDETTDKRNNENARSITLVILDLDEGEYVKDFFEAPDTISEGLFPHNFIAYTTAKHTPENPRLKVVVDIKECDLNLHKPLVHHIAVNLLGLPADFKGVRESKVTSQPAYRPMQFKNEEFTAVLCSRTNGIELDPTDIPEISDNDLDDMEYAYKGAIESSIAFLPISDILVDDIREPLFKIDPDCNYRVWTEVASALRHQFREEDEAREAYQLFDEWSATSSSKYKGTKSTQGKWRSFRPDTTGRNPITIRSLFKHAMDAGWSNGKVATVIQDNVIAWMASIDDKGILMSEGPSRVAAMPFKNAMVEEALINALRKRIKELGGELIDKTTIKKAISDVKFRDRMEKSSDTPNWLRPFCFIAPSNLFRNAANGLEYVPAAFDNAFSRHLMPKEEDSELAKTGRPMVLPTHMALNLIKIKAVDGVIYDPRHAGEEPYFEYDGKFYLNTYLPSSLPTIDTANAEAAGKLFMSHFDLIIKEPDYRKTIVDYLCFIVQNPGVKIPWAPIIQSAEGAGKGIIGEIMGAVLGKSNVKVISPAVIQSQWNDWQVGAALIILNEIHMPGHSREATMNGLKMAISDTTFTINKRNTSASVHANFSNYIGFTNYHDALHIKDSDRRYHLVESAIQTKEQVVRLNESGHFKRLARLITEWGGALRHWMLEYKISSDFPVHGPAPDTTYRQEIIDESKNPLQTDIENLLQMDCPLFQPDIIHYERLVDMTSRSARNNSAASRFLQILGYQRYMKGKLFKIGDQLTSIWVHRTQYDEDFGLAEDLLRERYASMDEP